MGTHFLREKPWGRGWEEGYEYGCGIWIFLHFGGQIPEPWDSKIVHIWSNIPFWGWQNRSLGQNLWPKSPEIPREGTEEVFKSDTYASKPPPPPFSLPRLDTATCIMSECSEQPPPLVLTMLGVVRLRAGTWKAVCWKLARSASGGWWEDRRAQAAGSFLRPRFT